MRRGGLLGPAACYVRNVSEFVVILMSGFSVKEGLYINNSKNENKNYRNYHVPVIVLMLLSPIM